MMQVILAYDLIPDQKLALRPENLDKMGGWLADCSRVINEEKWLDSLEMATGTPSYSQENDPEKILDGDDEKLLRGRYTSLVISAEPHALVVGMLNPFMQPRLKGFMDSLGLGKCLFVTISPHHFFRCTQNDDGVKT